jgi:hypothetical protein
VNVLGYTADDTPVTVRAGETARVEIGLRVSAIQLDEVVANAVTGRAERKRELGTNTASISARDLELKPITKMSDVLVGRAAGVQLQGAAGSVGTSQRIRIRGANSISLSNDPRSGGRFARIKVPPVFPRLLRIPSEDKADSYESLGLVTEAATHFIWLEEVIAVNLDLLFPGMEIQAAYPSASRATPTEIRKTRQPTCCPSSGDVRALLGFQFGWKSMMPCRKFAEHLVQLKLAFSGLAQADGHCRPRS